MREMLRPALVLFAICLVVGAAMAFTNMATSDVIAQRAVADAENTRKVVFSDADEFVKLKVDKIKASSKNNYDCIKEVYAAKINGKTTGYVFQATPKGYGGEINVMVGINDKGMVTGVQVGDNKETPGLGAKAKDAGFTGQYIGKKFGLISVVKSKVKNENEIEAISGATITSKAVSKGVEQASAMAGDLLNNGLGVSEDELAESN